MAAPFDAKLMSRLLKLPAIAITAHKTKKVTFESVSGLARALLPVNTSKTPADVFLVAKSVGFRKKEGGVPLVIPGYAPVADVVARVAAGEDRSAIASSIGARRPDIDNAVTFHAQWFGKSPAVAKKPEKPAAPARKPDPAVTRKAAGLPGPEAQVEGVIRVAAAGKDKPRKLAAAAVAELRLASGAPLPASLRCWLAHDTHLTPERKKGRLVARTLAQIAKELAPHLLELDLEFSKLPGDCYPLQIGDEQASFLYAGIPDSDGELPVLVLDSREQDVVLAAPGFDVWLATVYDLVESESIGTLPRAYGKLMTEHGRLNLGGKKALAL